MDYITTSTFKEFAWNTLTESQQIRICLKYELKQKLENNKHVKKRDIYKEIANRFISVTWEYVEKVAFFMYKEGLVNK